MRQIFEAIVANGQFQMQDGNSADIIDSYIKLPFQNTQKGKKICILQLQINKAIS